MAEEELKDADNEQEPTNLDPDAYYGDDDDDDEELDLTFLDEDDDEPASDGKSKDRA